MRYFVTLLLVIPVCVTAQLNKPRQVDMDKAAYKILTVPEKPDFIAADGNEAWVVDDHHNRMLKIAAEGKTILLSVPVPEACTAPVVAFGSLWVMSCTEKKMYRINHANGKTETKINMGLADTGGEMSIAASGDAIWVLTDSAGILTRIDPRTNKIAANIRVLPFSYCAVYHNGSVWISNYRNNSVQRIDASSNKITAAIPVGKKPRFIAANGSDIWTLNQGDGTVSRINTSINKPVASIDAKAPGSGGDIAAAKDKVWIVSTNTERPVQTINKSTNRIETIYLQHPKNKEVFKVDGGVRVSGKYVWISGYHSKTVWVLKN